MNKSGAVCAAFLLGMQRWYPPIAIALAAPDIFFSNEGDGT